MSWTSITSDHLKTQAYGTIVDKARGAAVGGIDPVAQTIAGATARVRRAVSTGNALDIDPTKVPNSLIDVTIRIAVFELCGKIGYDLPGDWKDQRRDDQSDLKRISDQKVRVEAPDTSDGGQSMQSEPTPAIRRHHRQLRTGAWTGYERIVLDRISNILGALGETGDRKAETGEETLAEFTKRAAAAFEADMAPVREAIVAALHDDRGSALADLRALLPHLLDEVNRAPALGDLLAHQIGAAFLEAFRDPLAVDPILNAKYNVRKPKGQTGGGRFVAGGAMQLGPNIARAQSMLEADMQACGVDTDPDPANVVDKLCARLKVKNPERASTKLMGIHGASQQEAAAIYAHIQGVFDMLPPRVITGHGAYKGLPAFAVKVVDEPGSNSSGRYEHQPPTLVLNRSLGGLDKSNVFHELAHHIHFTGPPSFRAAVQKHFRRRTSGEAIQNNGQIVAGVPVEFKRDHFCTDYAGRIYAHESFGGIGAELPTTHLEHLGSARACLLARTAEPNSAHYKETMSVALSIFYYGRPTK